MLEYLKSNRGRSWGKRLGAGLVRELGKVRVEMKSFGFSSLPEI